MSGLGKMTYPSGQVYIGYFKSDMRNGQGTLIMPSGQKIKGNWKDGELQTLIDNN